MTDFNDNDNDNDTQDPADDFDIVQWIWEIIKMGIIIVIGLFLQNIGPPPIRSPIPAWALLLGLYVYFRKKK